MKDLKHVCLNRLILYENNGLGSGKEVGRSGFLVTSDNSNILLDYGVLLKREPSFPIHIRPKDISTVVLTHAHLDHSGFIPSLFYLMPTSPS